METRINNHRNLRRDTTTGDLELALDHPELLSGRPLPQLSKPAPMDVHFSKAFPFLKLRPVEPKSVSLTAEDLPQPEQHDSDNLSDYKEGLKHTLATYVRNSIPSLPETYLTFRREDWQDRYFAHIPVILRGQDGAPQCFVFLLSRTAPSHQVKSLEFLFSVGRLRWPNLKCAIVSVCETPRVYKGQPTPPLITPKALCEALLNLKESATAERFYVSEGLVVELARKIGALDEKFIALGGNLQQFLKTRKQQAEGTR